MLQYKDRGLFQRRLTRVATAPLAGIRSYFGGLMAGERRGSASVAWRILLHERARNALAIGGIFIAVLMIFLQLGFYFCVPIGGMLVYDHLRFDLLMTSSAYVFQGQAYDFPQRRLYQASTLPEVKSVSPFYEGETQWLNELGGLRRDVFVLGFKLEDESVAVPDVERQIGVLKRPDTVLVDSLTLPMYGPQTRGRIVEIGDRAIEIGGRYTLGTGFLGLGVVMTSDLNFTRIFPERTLGMVNLGLIRLKPNSDLNAVASKLRALLPADTQIFTRSELVAEEMDYWKTRTATGLIFGFGAITSIIVGAVILYQTLATQVSRQLPQYATLKAMGYTDSYVRHIVLALAMFVAGVAFVPALLAALVLYDRVGEMTRLPIEMTVGRVLFVLTIALSMSAAAALLAVRRVGQADPADFF